MWPMHSITQQQQTALQSVESIDVSHSRVTLESPEMPAAAAAATSARPTCLQTMYSPLACQPRPTAV